MTPFTDPVLELRLVAHKAEAAMAAVLAGSATHLDLEDHRTAVLGELLDAVDRIDPGLGNRLLHALYPVLRTAECGERRTR
jgi:hypothetical protein